MIREEEKRNEKSYTKTSSNWDNSVINDHINGYF